MPTKFERLLFKIQLKSTNLVVVVVTEDIFAQMLALVVVAAGNMALIVAFEKVGP